MGALTIYLQQEFATKCPPAWKCNREVQLLSSDLVSLLGYAPRVDVLLEQRDGSRRLWIEFEVSRADPVANHAKFATAHLFQPQPQTDIFVSMVSPHVTRGRQNLAANTIFLMRHIGMEAFQTVLFPEMPPTEIKRLNHLNQKELLNENLDVVPELQRAITVSEAVITMSEHRVHFAGNVMEVMLNLRQWNEDLTKSGGNNLWDKRTITYFVFDPHSRNFAPSKFCAYINIPTNIRNASSTVIKNTRSEMTVELYVTLDGIDSRFDGKRAWTHLVRNLRMMPRKPSELLPDVLTLFRKWLDIHKSSITVHPAGPIFLLPPKWF